eukprot:GHVS01005962.1.p1 GENE.GHVS01005962.1~~GHVS01005962.1.p1  ORF type:complete len:327 (+),score=20.39 GHVS01005962.1:1-981(+)
MDARVKTSADCWTDHSMVWARIKLAVKNLKAGKAAGPDGIPPELVKAGGHLTVTILHRLLARIWASGTVPVDWKVGYLIPLHKKGAKEECSNYRGIMLLSCVGKLLSIILLDRLLPVLSATLTPNQCGYRANRSTTDLIFATRQLIEKSIEHRQSVHMVFVDLSKAFDTVPRDALWSLLGKLNTSTTVLNLVRELHTDNSASVVCGNDVTASFPMETGVRQGCILAPLLFNTYLSAVLNADPQRCGGVQGIADYTNTTFLPLHRRRRKAHSFTVRSMEYADDINLVVADRQELSLAITDLDTRLQRGVFTTPHLPVRHTTSRGGAF